MTSSIRSTAIRWTAGILLPVGALAVAAVLARSGGAASFAPQRHPPPVAFSGPTPGEPEELPTPRSPAPVAADPAPPPSSPARSSAWNEGYREAGESPGEGTLTGQVVTPDGPGAGRLVKAEWVMAFQPKPEDVARLKRAGAIRDRNGVWWGRRTAGTDDGGYFSIEGLPAVQLRITAGRDVQTARPGGSVVLRAGNPLQELSGSPR